MSFSFCIQILRSSLTLITQCSKPNTSFTGKDDDTPLQPLTTSVVEKPVAVPTGSQSELVEGEMSSTTLPPPPQATAVDICPAMAQVATSSDIVPTGMFLITHSIPIK